MPRGGQWAIALVLVVLGFMLSMQWRVQQKVAAADVTVERVEDLTQQLRGVERERDALTKEVADLRTQVQNLANREAHYKDLAGELERLRVAAGLVPLEGPGVRVVLDDSARPWRPGENPNAFIIHDEDILRVVNELLASGAEAIAVNGQRLTARSEIRCVGPTVMVNGVRTSTPVEILAIGDPDTLERGLRLKGGVLDVLELYSIQVSVEKRPQVRIPAYRGSLQFDHARPVSE
ncbi:DUF881 domain-containing protein [Caldinitratiruptor microaerophilus]|uniref:DUF881 domain-containing protein n=1 Tax=Caldinitratiruptor microaerophilus TaxID=671077 RepID=A0AA35G8S7_9FIRM|nr:DUF881 domain-containing protein [Caldinitratiruptor microaerophilus]BDG60753.1 hypothetical protein caldi_18430 [Caldinitratiruptor microaerophilus]